jgi:hypothetical protein
MVNIKSPLPLLASLITPPVVAEMTTQIVDRLPGDFSLMRNIPSPVIRFNDMLYTPFICLEEQLDLSRFTSHQVVGPLYEEFVYRVGIQKILLKDLPKRIFSKNETVLNFIDSAAAKIGRILLTASLFTALHYSPKRDEQLSMGMTELGNVSFVISFLGGLTTGALMELTDNPIYPMAYHVAHNVFVHYS